MSLMLEDESHQAGRVGVALVGLGRWGSNLSRALGDSADAEVRWICDVDSSRLAKYRRRHPDARVTTRLDRILADSGVDVIALGTPVDACYELAMSALEAGKHVFVRTPLAASAELADELATVARERGCIMMCSDTFLYSPSVRAVKRMIEGGTLGELQYISSSRGNLGLEQEVGSVIWDLGPREFSILLYWLSEMPTSVRAVGRGTNGITDVAFVTMSFASGIVVNVELSWLAPSKLRRTTVVGTERMVVYEDGGPDPVRVFDCGVVDHVPEAFGEYQPTRRSGEIVSPSIESYEPLDFQLSDLVQAIRSGETMEYQTTLTRSVIRIAQSADESLRLGGVEVSPTGEEVTARIARRRGLAAV